MYFVLPFGMSFQNNVSAKTYWPAMGEHENGGGSAPSTTESARQQVVPCDMDISGIRVFLTTAPGSGKSWNFTVRKNGVDTGVAVVLSDSETYDENLAQTVHFATGDLISIASEPISTPATNAFAVSLLGSTVGPDVQPILARSYNPSTSTTSREGLFGVGNTGGFDAVNSVLVNQHVVAAAGVISGMRVHLDAAPGSGKSYVFSMYKNNGAASMSCTLSNSQVDQNSASTVSVVPGDLIHIDAVPSGTPTQPTNVAFSFIFTPTTPGDMIFGGSTSNMPNPGPSYGAAIGKRTGISGTESSAAPLIFGPYILKKMYVNGDPPTSGKTVTGTLRKTGADTGLTATISNTATAANVASDVPLAAADTIKVKYTSSGGIAAALVLAVGYCLNIPSNDGGSMLPFFD